MRSSIVLLTLGLSVTGLVRSEGGPVSGCPGHDLSRYASQPYATDKGIDRRCGLLADIERDGVLSPGTLREQVMDELSNRFTTRIDFTGEVDLPRRAVDYLLDNMPETAALVNTYSDKDYRATQTRGAAGSKRFFVTNHDKFAASFTYLFSRLGPDASEYMFFESGFAKVFFWRVWGNSFVRYRLNERAGHTSGYDIGVHVFTDSRVLRVLLDSAPFRYFARSMFGRILEDIESAVRSFAADTNPGDVLPPYFVTGLKRQLEDVPFMPAPREQYIPNQYRRARP